MPNSALRAMVLVYFIRKHIFRRNDGSQAAYVGSANLTPAGIGGQNVEAGLIIDTRQGNFPAVLDAVAGSVNSWFTPIRARA